MSVVLSVDGKQFDGWQRVSIERGIEQIAGGFELTVTDRWNANGKQAAFEIKPGQACTVAIDGKTVITGYLDSVSRSYDKAAHQITVSGRDKTADLVDCSAIHKTGQWSNKTLAQIAADLLKPFGIPLQIAVDVGKPMPVFALQEGETVFEALERAARMRALLLIADGLGGLLMTRAGTERAAGDLFEGGNILRAEGEFSWKDRYSDYLIKGQSHGSDDEWGEAVAQRNASAKDASINRYRPLIVMAEHQDGTASLQQRAEWERNVRQGRSTTASITVQGWKAHDILWQPNTLTHLKSPLLSADLDLLIVQATYTLDDGGTTTTLKLSHPSAFEVINNVKQTRLEKKLRQKDRDNSSIDDQIWQNP